MHLDEEQLQRLVHGERTAAAVHQHLAECGDCRTRVTTAQREDEEVFRLLEQLDAVPASRISAQQVVARARTRDYGWMRIAAAVVLSVSIVGVAYAAPGSPLRRWVMSIVEHIGGESRAPSAPPSPPQTADDLAGIAVEPGASLVILFTRQSTGHARVSLVDTADVILRAPAGAAGFTSEVGRLIVVNRDSASFDILIPRHAAQVEIRVVEQRIFVKRGSRVETRAQADSLGVYAIPLRPAPR